MKKVDKIEKKCKACNKVFETYPKSNRKFCSKKCAGNFNNNLPLRKEKTSARMKKLWADKNSIFNSKEYRVKLSNGLSKRLEFYKNHPGFHKIPHPGLKKRWAEDNSKYRNEESLKMKREKISLAMTGKYVGEKNPMFGKVAYPKLQYSENLEHNYRSSWEEEVCTILKNNNIFYDYELEHFKIKLDNKLYTYTPDIKLTGTNIFIEVKGPIFPHQLAKMKAFKEQYPENKLYVIAATKKKRFSEMYNFADKTFDYFEFIQNRGDVKLQLS